MEKVTNEWFHYACLRREKLAAKKGLQVIVKGLEDMAITYKVNLEETQRRIRVLPGSDHDK